MAGERQHTHNVADGRVRIVAEAVFEMVHETVQCGLIPHGTSLKRENVYVIGGFGAPRDGVVGAPAEIELVEVVTSALGALPE
jgi:hypothetical protein